VEAGALFLPAVVSSGPSANRDIPKMSTAPSDKAQAPIDGDGPMLTPAPVPAPDAPDEDDDMGAPPPRSRRLSPGTDAASRAAGEDGCTETDGAGPEGGGEGADDEGVAAAAPPLRRAGEDSTPGGGVRSEARRVGGDRRRARGVHASSGSARASGVVGRDGVVDVAGAGVAEAGVGEGGVGAGADAGAWAGADTGVGAGAGTMPRGEHAAAPASPRNIDEAAAL